jgi:transcriptional regulator GlxA family with amidase domain
MEVVARETGFASERTRRAFLRFFGQPPQSLPLIEGDYEASAA